MKLTKLLMVSGLMMAFGSQAQTCYTPSILETTPTANFEVIAPGVIKDNSTDLVWSRCVLGQSWNASTSTCDGTGVQLTWQEALQQSADSTLGGYTNWRLPNAKELATIVEKSCVDPSVNLLLFPAAPPENHWTSTTVADTHTSAWGVVFNTGRNSTKEKSLDLYVRLVRFAD